MTIRPDRTPRLFPGEVVNTELEPRGRSIDLLENAAAVRLWLLNHGLIGDATTVAVADIRRLHALRAAVRSVFAAAADNGSPERDALAVLNAVYAAGNSPVGL